MLINTKYFGQVDIGDEKIITFEDGLMGFEKYKKYTILYDNSREKRSSISWLQSVDEKTLALPIINPFYIMEEYNPTVEGELLDCLGEMTDENTVVFVTLTVPSNIKAMTANLRAPLVINSDTRKARQIILDNSEYPIKFNVYDAVQKLKASKEKE